MRDITHDLKEENGASKSYLVRIKTPSGEYEGTMFSAFPTRRLSEVITMAQEFINLKDAKDLLSKEKYPFMVISKHHIETIKVLDER